VIRSLLQNGLALIVVCSMLFAPQKAMAADQEYLIKAAFIYNFVKFVEWPDGRAISQKSSIDICVFGESPMQGTSAVFKAASTAKLGLSLVTENNVQNISGHCHIVFISSSEEGRLGEILAALKGHPVLTVSDMDGFADAGGMMGFVADDNKIRVDVNKKAMVVSGLHVDAQLLEIAHKVIDK